MKIKYAVFAAVLLIVAAVTGVRLLPSADAPEAVQEAKATSTVTRAKEGVKEKKALIVYFSYTGNTRILAEEIQQSAGGDLFELQPEAPYSTEYKVVESQGKREVESGYQPPLAAKVENLAAYDVVFVGTPIWWYTIAPPVATFLAEPDLAGKTIVPFCTHGGYGAGHSLEDIKKLAPNSTVQEMLVLRGSDRYDAKEITQWLEKTGL